MRNQKEEFFELIYAQYAKKLERICLRYVNYQPEYREIAADSGSKDLPQGTRGIWQTERCLLHRAVVVSNLYAPFHNRTQNI